MRTCHVVLLLICGLYLKTALAETCDVESKNCECKMPKLYDCPTVDLTLDPVPDGCHLLKHALSTREFSNITCGANDTDIPLSNGVTFVEGEEEKSLMFTNNDCQSDFYFVVFLDGGQLAIAEVATKILTAVTNESLTIRPTRAPGFPTPTTLYSSREEENRKRAQQQASAILIIEDAIGTVTAEAGDVVIVATTPTIVVVSSPVDVHKESHIINLETYANESNGEGSKDQISVYAIMMLPDLELETTNSSEARFTAIQISTDDMIDTPQNTAYNTAASATRSNDEGDALQQDSLINSDIMSLTLYVKGQALSNIPVEISFTNIRQVHSYMNETLRSEVNSTCSWLTDHRQWSHSGCQTSYNESNENHTVCRCWHTTSFAVLMQVVDFEISKPNKIALDFFSYLGIGLSIMCLVIALFIFFTVGALRASERNMIHRNLMIALLLAYITFLAGIDHATEIPILCKAVAALMHYLYTAVFSWMLIEGIHLYLMLVKVFGSEGSKRVYYLAVGWGAPIIVVAISVGIMHDDYGTDEKQAIHCFVLPLFLSITCFLVWTEMFLLTSLCACMCVSGCVYMYA